MIRRIQYNAPVVMTFALLSLLALLANEVSDGWTNVNIFSVYRAPLNHPHAFLRLVFHVLGHSNWEHYCSNMMLILVVGPQLEQRYGSRNIFYCILVTALITGVAQYVFFPGVALYGASGIVFMMLLLASMGGMRNGHIPLTMILVAAFYLSNEINSALSVKDNISQFSHVIGAFCGTGLGFYLGDDRKVSM